MLERVSAKGTLKSGPDRCGISTAFARDIICVSEAYDFVVARALVSAARWF